MGPDERDLDLTLAQMTSLFEERGFAVKFTVEPRPATAGANYERGKWRVICDIESKTLLPGELGQDAATWTQYASDFGFTVDDRLGVFEDKGDRYVVVGINPRYKKYNVLAVRRRDGKRYKFGADYVRAAGLSREV